jgi:hypothetical protein
MTGTHRWHPQGRSGYRCDRCGMFRYRLHGKIAFSLNGFRLKLGRRAKAPECTG